MWIEVGRLPKNSKKPDNVSRTFGVDRGGPTTKESGGGETAKLQESTLMMRKLH